MTPSQLEDTCEDPVSKRGRRLSFRWEIRHTFWGTPSTHGIGVAPPTYHRAMRHVCLCWGETGLQGGSPLASSTLGALGLQPAQGRLKETIAAPSCSCQAPARSLSRCGGGRGASFKGVLGLRGVCTSHGPDRLRLLKGGAWSA